MHSEILLVEDDSNDILLIERAFKRCQIEIPLRVVTNGDDAVSYLLGRDLYSDRARYPLPSLVLLDLKLPRRSGLEVLEWMRQQSVIRRIPVVVLTSSREDTDVDRAYELGVNSYLQKPVSYDALNEMIQALNTYWLQLNQFPKIAVS